MNATTFVVAVALTLASLAVVGSAVPQVSPTMNAAAACVDVLGQACTIGTGTKCEHGDGDGIWAAGLEAVCIRQE